MRHAPDDETEERRRELGERLGAFRFGTRPELKALAVAMADEHLIAVLVGFWRRHAWVMAATERGLYLSRRPLVIGRGGEDVSLSWSDLLEFHAGSQRVDLVFGDQTVELKYLGPQREFDRLVEAARQAVRD